ncbi:3-oxoadipate enol-lactonase [Amycolatopsis xylanica]|uniref:3-oxoadipate enol-lactonase n=1 Tax=Amycolatopsis xylanica TaxID=589385 RepID=A0A1H3QZS1_9PSEU|nr:3-oxoadipate enol-lactonase [Amycolatopsis xylanica]SDZ18189.1 3-oxoadipate enol-lactonase [Amycolatopsis xylanica]
MSVAVHYETFGDGIPVVFSGSVGSSLRMWDDQVRTVAASGYRTIAYDHRGHGASPVPPGPYAIPDFGEDVLALLDKLGIERAHLVGLSLGGMTGMWLGAHAPERIRSLTLCCTSAELGPPSMWVDRANTVRAGGLEAIADGGLARWVTPSFTGDRQSLRDMLVSTPQDGYIASCQALERMDLAGDLPKITAPTLVIAGSEDVATPVEHARRIVDGIPGARLEIVEGAAHLGNVEQPEAFTQLILDHLKGSDD